MAAHRLLGKGTQKEFWSPTSTLNDPPFLPRSHVASPVTPPTLPLPQPQ